MKNKTILSFYDFAGKKGLVNTKFDALVPLGRRSLIQTTNLFITIMIASLASIKFFFLGFDDLPISAFFVITAGLANAIYIRRHGSMEIAAWILVITALLGLAFSSVNTGGFGAPVVMLAPIIPIMTVLLINMRAAWISLALACLILTGILPLPGQ